uniref:Activator of Hsp90 ATPase AHSA1-like N-terminal domain-containing protein n=1 Tax=Ursus maritimus TaxID=29073 RepID=A0A452UZ51_URSMA
KSRWGEAPQLSVETGGRGASLHWLWDFSFLLPKLPDLLVGIVVENEAGGGEIGELKQVEGEASWSSCKGKLIFFYEWNISLSWKGKGGAGSQRRSPMWGSIPELRDHALSRRQMLND